MAICVKCDLHEDNHNLGGVCSHCGIDRGWKTSTSTEGRVGVFCEGCSNGFTVLECPKCGHSIEGSDLKSEPEDPLLGCLAIIGFVILILFIGAAGM